MAAQRPATGKAHLTLTINGMDYRVRPILTEESRAYGLHKLDGTNTVYHVRDLRTGAECSCADFVMRREWNDRDGCKHIKALRIWWLVE